MPTPWPSSLDRSRYRDYFAELRKHPIVSGDTLWFESGPSFYQSFPFHEVHKAADVDLRDVFRSPRALAARYAQVPEQGRRSAPSSLWVRREPYSLDVLSSNTRSKVRRGLKNTSVERIDFATLLDRGFPLVASTAARQRVRFGNRQAASFTRMCETAARHPMMEAWGGYVGDALAVFAVCFQVDDCLQISTVRSDSELLNSYPNNALIHTLMDGAYQRAGVTSVCYGLASLDRGTGGLSDFKRSAGFDPEPIDDVIVGRMPILAARGGAPILRRIAGRSHRLAQFATIAETVSWWRRPT